MHMDEIPLILEREVGMAPHVPEVAVGFGMVAIEDVAKSAKEGRPIFREEEFFMCVVPGDKQSKYLQPAKDEDRLKFPRAYAAFKTRHTETTEGTPLEQWPAMSRGMALGFKAMHIHSVEALAQIHDGNLGKLGQGAREWRTKAQAYIAQAKDSAAAQALAVEVQKRDDEIAELKRMINDLASRVPEKRGPGRPRKDEAEAA